MSRIAPMFAVLSSNRLTDRNLVYCIHGTLGHACCSSTYHGLVSLSATDISLSLSDSVLVLAKVLVLSEF